MAEELNKATFLEEWKQAQVAVTEFLEEKPLPAEAMGLSKDDMGAIYKNAYNAFQAEDYSQAENLFLTLFIMNFKEYDFQVGLGAAYEAQEKFENALAMYSLAMITRDQNPEMLFRAGKCLLALGKKDEAGIMFELAGECDPKKGTSRVATVASIEKSKRILELLDD